MCGFSFLSILLADETVVWTCSRAREDPEHCSFWIWVDDEVEAKEWLTKHERVETPETPPKVVLPPRLPETPWTKARRKLSWREASGEDENGGSSKRKGDGDRVQVLGGDEGSEYSPSRKVPKFSELTTPGCHPFMDKLKEAAPPLTPDTLDPKKGKSIEEASIQQANTLRRPSPLTDNSKDCTIRGIPNLASRVLRLIREDNLELKGSTELLIRHEIEVELGLNVTKVASCERTILRMAERINKLESNISDWIGDERFEEGKV